MYKIASPSMGKEYNQIVERLFKDLEINYIPTPPITDNTIKIGVRNSPDMMCYPFKLSLGNMVESLDMGADTILMYDTCGQCRFKHYNKLQEYTLRRMGYNFNMVSFSGTTIIQTLKKLSNKSTIHILKSIKKCYLDIKESDERNYIWSENKLNIGVIGEIYTCCEEKVNYNIEDQIGKLGANCYNTSRLHEFIVESIKEMMHVERFIGKRKYKREASKYLNGKLGGHGWENIYNLLWLIDKKVDGIIHLMPLSCFVEDTMITLDDYSQKLIKNIAIGDKVLTHKGNICKVTNTLSRDYNGNIISINCGGISKIKVTPEHPIFSIKRVKSRLNNQIPINPKFIKAEELNKGDFIAVPKPNNILDKKFIKSEMINQKVPKYTDMNKFLYNYGMFRLLGYYLAEGAIFYDRKKSKIKPKKYLSGVRFTFHIKEIGFIQDIISILKENGIDSYSKVYTNKHRPNVADLHISNRSLAYFLNKLGGRYCDKKEIHSEILNLPSELQLEIAKGFFRGDGSLTDKYGETRYRAVTTSFKLASQLYWILIRNNIKCSLLQQNIKNRKVSYMLSISNANGINRIKDENIKITDRINKVRFLETNTHFYIPILKISKDIYDGKVFNLEVEEDNSYIANLLAVHNCMPESTIEPILNGICQDNKLPLLRLMIDETNSEANVTTRVETFIELIKRKKNGTNRQGKKS